MQYKFRLLLILLILTFCVTAAHAANGGGKGRSSHELVKLKAMNSNTNVGFAETFMKAKKRRTDQSFHVQLYSIPSSTNFTLMVDGKVVDAFTSSPGGTFNILFSTNPKNARRPLPASLNPVTAIRLVEIKVTNGQTLAEGTFGSDEGDMEREIALNSTGIIPNAHGEAKIEIEQADNGDDDSGDDDNGDDDNGDNNNQGTTKQSFELEVENLTASTTFVLFADGNQVTTFTTDNEGSAELQFSSSPEDEEMPLPPALSSLANVKLIEIRTTDGKVVLMGSF